MKYDMIIIGAGPAGISTAIYGKSRGMDVLVIEKNKVGGMIGNVSTVTHYSAIVEQETGDSFAKRLQQQAENAGVAFIYEDVIKVELTGEEKVVTTKNGSYKATAIVIANGTTPRMLEIPGETELAGKGMRMNAARDGKKYAGKNVYVVGGADGAIKEAIYLASIAKKVTIIHFEEQLGCVAEFKEKLKKLSNVEVVLQTRLTRVLGENHVEKLELLNIWTGEKTMVEDDGCGVFVYAGALPNTQLYHELKLEDGYIPVNEKMETVIPGVYAVGDIRVKQVRQVATAVADGAVAGVNASAYVVKQ